MGPTLFQPLDVKTLIVVLAMGNAIAVLLLLFDTKKISSIFDSLFIAGRAFQFGAWILIGLRGNVSDLLSFSIGNSVFFCGIALEGLSLVSLEREPGRTLFISFASLLAFILAAWWFPGVGRIARIVVAACLEVAFFVIPGSLLAFSGDDASPLRRFIGISLLLCSSASIARGVNIMVAGSYDLIVPNFFQVLVFLIRILMMILGSTGYILIRKEEVNSRLTRASEEKNLLFKELQHRVKNSLAIISGLTSLEADRRENAGFRESMEKVRDRIDAVSRLYDFMSAEDSARGVRLDLYVKDLTEHLLEGYSSSPGRILLEFELERIEVDAKTSMAVGIIVNELATNAMKHAFPGDRRGKIRVRLAEREGKVELEVTDDGVGAGGRGIEPESDAEGLGTLIVSMLVKQIEGSMSRSSTSGTAVKIVF
jgi:two-component sensor histidine kinase